MGFHCHARRQETGFAVCVVSLICLCAAEFEANQSDTARVRCGFSQQQSSPSQIITTMTTARRRSSAGDVIGVAPGFATYPRRASRVIANVLSHKMADVTTPLPGWPNNKDEYELGQVIGEYNFCKGLVLCYLTEIRCICILKFP